MPPKEGNVPPQPPKETEQLPLQPPSPSLKRPLAPKSTSSPSKKQTKWTPEEDAIIIELRGRNEKWEDISKKLPGRSTIAARLRYQNYIERQSVWDDEKKTKLARLYERFKSKMWSEIANEMGIPWRTAEAMHWQLGEQDMARRAGAIPFSLSSTAVDAPSSRGRGAAASGSGVRGSVSGMERRGEGR